MSRYRFQISRCNEKDLLDNQSTVCFGDLLPRPSGRVFYRSVFEDLKTTGHSLDTPKRMAGASSSEALRDAWSAMKEDVEVVGRRFSPKDWRLGVFLNVLGFSKCFFFQRLVPGFFLGY